MTGPNEMMAEDEVVQDGEVYIESPYPLLKSQRLDKDKLDLPSPLESRERVLHWLHSSSDDQVVDIEYNHHSTDPHPPAQMRARAFEAEESTVPVPKEILNFRVYVLAIVASMGDILFGYDLAFIGTSIGLAPFVR
jgi:hypothetical protein